MGVYMGNHKYIENKHDSQGLGSLRLSLWYLAGMVALHLLMFCLRGFPPIPAAWLVFLVATAVTMGTFRWRKAYIAFVAVYAILYLLACFGGFILARLGIHDTPIVSPTGNVLGMMYPVSILLLLASGKRRALLVTSVVLYSLSVLAVAALMVLGSLLG